MYEITYPLPLNLNLHLTSKGIIVEWVSYKLFHPCRLLTSYFIYIMLGIKSVSIHRFLISPESLFQNEHISSSVQPEMLGKRKILIRYVITVKLTQYNKVSAVVPSANQFGERRFGSETLITGCDLPVLNKNLVSQSSSFLMKPY